jgi:diguanylate cyclase
MSIERSTELLRQALPWMSRQAAALHPVSYAVWFDYVAQTNPPLRAAIDEHLAREGKLDEFATHALFSRHVADVDPETAQRVVDQMQRVLGGIGESAGAAGAYAARYGASLAQLAGALARGDTARGIDDAGAARNGPAPRQLADVVAEVIADTGTMRSRIGGLQQRLADSRREIDRLRDEVRRAREESLRDSLTGLSNRRAFDQALAACLTAQPAPTPAATARDATAAIEAARAPAAGRPPGAASAPAAPGPWLLMSDIDHFRRINDTFGHGFGDEVLKAVAEAMRALVPAGATLARVGGEAFALLVPELDAAGALALAERVRAHIGSARIRRPDQGEAERVTLSVGLAGGVVGEAPQALLERAGAALMQAKDGGRDRVVGA